MKLISPTRNDSFQKDLSFTTDVFFLFFIFYFNHRISEMRRPIGAKFCMVVRTRPKFIMPVQNFFGGALPKKF